MAMEKQGNQKDQEQEQEEEEEEEDDEEDEIREVHPSNTSASCYSSDESMAMKMDLVGSSRFAVPFPLQLTISKKQEYNKYGSKIHGDSYYDEADVSNMLVRDARDDILMTMLSAPPLPSRRHSHSHSHSRHMKSFYVPPKLCNRVLVLDSARVPILCAHRKALSLYNRWDVFRGELPNPEEALFHVKRSNYFQAKTSLHVFLASHKKGSKPQFKVKGNYLERNCTVFRESQIVAEVRRKYTDTSLPLEKNVFVVLVHPGMDYAFIVTLIAIMDEIHREQHYSSSIGSS